MDKPEPGKQMIHEYKKYSSVVQIASGRRNDNSHRNDSQSSYGEKYSHYALQISFTIMRESENKYAN